MRVVIFKHVIFLAILSPLLLFGEERWSLSGDFIYWNVREEGLAYAFGSEVHHPDFESSPGFKVDWGYHFAHDKWDMLAEYTWLYSDASNKSTGPNLFPMWDVGDLPVTTPLDRASTTWDLHFHALDLSLGRSLKVSEFLELRPFFGLKGTWQKQENKTDYRFTSLMTFPEISTLKLDQTFWGVGLRAGFESSYRFFRSFGLFGSFALADLWGHFSIDRLDKNKFDVHPNQIFLRTENDFFSIKPLVEIALGLRWTPGRFLFQIAWEEQIWFNQNQFFRLLEEGAHGDLTFQGLTLKARVNF